MSLLENSELSSTIAKLISQGRFLVDVLVASYFIALFISLCLGTCAVSPLPPFLMCIFWLDPLLDHHDYVTLFP